MANSTTFKTMQISNEPDIEQLQTQKAAQIARVKSLLLLVAFPAVIIVCIGLLILSVHFYHQKTFFENKLEKTKDITHPFLKKTLKALQHSSEKPSRMIWNKEEGECIDTDYESSGVCYLTDECHDNLSQQWSLVNGTINVGGFERCLQCFNDKPDCDLGSGGCNAGQKFFLQIKADQLDVAHRRVYFTINSQMYPMNCAGVYYNEEHEGNLLRLETCHGTDNQLFYLDDVDYEQEFKEMFKKSTDL